MTPLPHERRRFAETLRWLRDYGLLELGEHIEDEEIHGAEAALSWAIEKLEETP